jgi:Sigma-70, region 4
VRTRATEIANEPIERAVPHLATALGIPRRDLDVTADRLGWGQERALTLREVGARHGITRERVRQLVDRTVARLDGAYLPQIEQAAFLLAAHAPMTGADASTLLAAEGLTAEGLSPRAVLSLAEVTGYAACFQVDESCDTALVLPSGPVDAMTVLRAARRTTGRAGVALLCRVPTAVTGRNPVPLPLPVVTIVLRHSPGVAFLNDDWFWLPSTPPERNSLYVASRRMLSVARRLDLASIRNGLVRHQRLPLHHIAPPPVLAAFYRDHPDFSIGGDVVESAVPLDVRRTLSPGEQALVSALRRAPGGQLSRSALQRSVVAAGVNADAFAALVATTPILDHRGHDAWCLRGVSVGPEDGRVVGSTTGPS